MRFFGLVGVLVGAWLATGAWAQPGHGPRGGAAQGTRMVDREPHAQREELRTLIRQQPPSQWDEDGPEAQRHPRRLSPEERQNLRNQLRQQRGDDWRRPP